MTQKIFFALTLISALACQSEKPKITALGDPPSPAHAPEADLIRQYGMDPSAVGFLVYDRDARKVVVSHNPDQPFLPASVGKIATTLAALNVLGADYRFPTQLASRGKLKNGVLNGDLYLKGTGDPLLTIPELMNLVELLRRQAIRTVKGGFYYDASDMIEQEKINPQQNDDAVYNTSIGALASEFDRIMLNWQPDRRAEVLDAYLTPSLPIARVELGKPTEPPAESSDEAPGELTGRISSNLDTWVLPPDGPTQGKRELPVHHGNLYTALLFARLCEQAGITLPAPKPGVVPADAKIVATHLSAPLSELVARGLEWSNNLIAEQMLLATARTLAGPSAKPLSLADSASQVTKWLQTQIPKAPWAGYVAENGSGLSTRARLTAAQAVELLNWGDGRIYNEKSFLSMMPISGWKGTLRDRLGQPPTALKVWAKTGTMAYGTALAGYFFSHNNHKHLFAVFLGDPAKRGALDQIAPGSPEHQKMEKAAESWNEQGRKLQDALLAKWVTEN
jgi:D-alanyl-D-alanine carboxypeptidase/D-alanyl-D-alanine-endopeptidase (penicillin-binding protein 4)